MLGVLGRTEQFKMLHSECTCTITSCCILPSGTIWRPNQPVWFPCYVPPVLSIIKGSNKNQSNDKVQVWSRLSELPCCNTLKLLLCSKISFVILFGVFIYFVMHVAGMDKREVLPWEFCRHLLIRCQAKSNRLTVHRHV